MQNKCTKGIKILTLTTEYPPVIGGIATHVHQLNKTFSEKNNVIKLISTNKRVSASHNFFCDKNLNFKVQRVKVFRGRPFYTWALRSIIKKAMSSFSPDLVHVHGMRPLEATRGLECPVFFTNHTSGFLKRIERAKGKHEKSKIASRLNHLAGILAPSEELAEATRMTGYSGPVKFISNGVDPAVFSSTGDNCRERLGIAPEEIVVLLARRLAEKNGVLDFSKAMVRLSGKYSDAKNIRVVIAGDGDLRSEMEKILEHSCFNKNPIFLGAVQNQQMPSLYRSADMAILPSHYEATSITGLEAMSCGCPLVGTNVGGIPYLIGNNQAGLISEAHDINALAESIYTLSMDKNRQIVLGKNARARVLENFSWNKIADETCLFFEKNRKVLS